MECEHHFPRGIDGRINKCEFCNEEKTIEFFSIDGFFDKTPFLIGQKANFCDKNPYKTHTNSWFNWNRGKNTNNNLITPC